MSGPDAEQPTQAVTPGAEPTQRRSPGQADPDMVDPAQAVDAEFTDEHERDDPADEPTES